MRREERKARFEQAIAAIDAANAGDPNLLELDGKSIAKELLHAERATWWVRQLEPEPSEALLLAARAHHLRRWQWPRSNHPEGRAGYHAWRRELQRHHAREAASILEASGYEAALIERVGALICKQGLGREPEVQVLEDALCLVFVETQLEDFARRNPVERVIGILVKTLKKMSPAARERIPTIGSLSDAGRELALRAAARLEDD
ncbi:MAG: DUF4202 domain-containing protein [Deltaproteobacteria bacterium]|jgi:hypothetical protein|nr:DUF4202 domain-containing protein [Deltaproteobacteria bacterium]MBW2500333.1 DUF4202 domain-containing protein [Deltaproteobacteria bacterium]